MFCSLFFPSSVMLKTRLASTLSRSTLAPPGFFGLCLPQTYRLQNDHHNCYRRHMMSAAVNTTTSTSTTLPASTIPNFNLHSAVAHKLCMISSASAVALGEAGSLWENLTNMPNMVSFLTIGGVVLSSLSFLERQGFVLQWRLKRALASTSFSDTPNASFSALHTLRKHGEVPFSRLSLQAQLVSKIHACQKGKDALIVGGAGGLGKSMFW